MFIEYWSFAIVGYMCYVRFSHSGQVCSGDLFVDTGANASTLQYIFLTNTGYFLYVYAVFHILLSMCMPICCGCLSCCYLGVSIKAEHNIMKIIRQKEDNKIKKGLANFKKEEKEKKD